MLHHRCACAAFQLAVDSQPEITKIKNASNDHGQGGSQIVVLCLEAQVNIATVRFTSTSSKLK